MMDGEAHIAHVRKDQQPLQDDEALSLFGHVKRFLENLATKISEGPLYPLCLVEEIGL